ncbi:Uu.00g127520.m01.CDS01 [Anthostomella pinea]|uniref:Uu.00g127520.m01.CDS01 n=1 Tax=Anthostomella pinea TaxID=933095 RepID=A0AAI8VI66_9PEZI|nr:Uu.00g127520.m01.CDS01 [Anthostomella pinea]
MWLDNDNVPEPESFYVRLIVFTARSGCKGPISFSEVYCGDCDRGGIRSAKAGSDIRI